MGLSDNGVYPPHGNSNGNYQNWNWGYSIIRQTHMQKMLASVSFAMSGESWQSVRFQCQV